MEGWLSVGFSLWQQAISHRVTRANDTIKQCRETLRNKYRSESFGFVVGRVSPIKISHMKSMRRMATCFYGLVTYSASAEDLAIDPQEGSSRSLVRGRGVKSRKAVFRSWQPSVASNPPSGPMMCCFHSTEDVEILTLRGSLLSKNFVSNYR